MPPAASRKAQRKALQAERAAAKAAAAAAAETAEPASPQQEPDQYDLITFNPEEKLAFQAIDKTFTEDLKIDPTTVFNKNPTRSVDWGLTTSFLLAHCAAKKVRSGDNKDQIALGTVNLAYYYFRKYVINTTGTDIDEGIRKNISGFIRTDLDTQIGVFMEKPDRMLIDDDHIREMITTTLSPGFFVLDFRARIQFAFALSTFWDTGIRVGSILRRKPDDRYKNLSWGMLKIIINKGQDINQVSIFFKTPNGKTKTSKNLPIELFPKTKSNDDRLIDKFLYLLILANYDDALPQGWNLEKLYDPSIFDGTSTTYRELLFNPAKKDQPLMVGGGFWSSRTTSTYWSTQSFRTMLASVSRFCNFDQEVTPHVIRRSRGVLMRMNGTGYQDIARQLAHEFGTATYEAYVGEVLVADPTKAFHGGNSTLDETITHHPSKVKKIIPLKDTITAEIYCKIFAKNHIASIVDQIDETVYGFKEQHRVDRVNQLPKACQTKIKGLWQKFRHAFDAQREYYRRALAMEKIDKRGNAIDYNGRKEALGTENDDDDEEEDEEEDVQSNPSKTGDVDDDLDGEVIDYEIIAYENFLSTNDMTNARSGLQQLLSEDIIDSDTATSILLQHDVPNENWGNASSSRHQPGQSEATNDANMPPAASSSSLPATKAQTTSNNDNSDAEDDEDEEEDNDDDEAITEDPRPLYAALAMLKNENQSTESPINHLFTTYHSLLAVPRNLTLNSHYRPGHSPQHSPCRGLCPFDNTHIIDLREPVQKIRTHVNNCGALAAKHQVEGQLLDLYEPFIPYDPVTHTSAPRTQQTNVLTLHYNRIRERYSPKHSNDSYPVCESCAANNIEVLLPSADCHLWHLVSHDIWATTKVHSTKTELTKKCQQGIWDSETARFPTPVYTSHDQAYHATPADILSTAEFMYDEFILKPTEGIVEYGLRTDIEIPEKLMDEEDQQYPSDLKYLPAFVKGTNSAHVKDAFCVLCVNDFTKPIVERMNPFNERRNEITEHTQYCLSSHLIELSELEKLRDSKKKIPLRHNPFWEDGKIRCLDVVCQRNEQIFKTKLGFVRHLVTVHHLPLRGALKTDNKRSGYTLDQLCPGTKDELQKFMYAKRSAAALKREKKQGKKRGLDEVSGSGTKAGEVSKKSGKTNSKGKK